ncbi:hypothetical protein KUCAC02_001286 [Chaenocephalus aceratus]|uniref:Uncharacterized protein n=1 Tax=Chaenocephalus aceratus TaxID=36190 RepID=A0ACB9XX66_CHAAC|nr:hypothetical protein KUCAC02_001286 [Chaenocephalus aceratus]
MQRSDTAEKGGTFLVEHSGFPSPSVSMDVLANHSIFQELQIVHDTGYFLRHAFAGGELAAARSPHCVKAPQGAALPSFDEEADGGPDYYCEANVA